MNTEAREIPRRAVETPTPTTEQPTTTQTPQPRVAILVRVSTNRQDTERQITELTAYAHQRQYIVTEVIQETTSGSSKDRPGLDRTLQLARDNQIDKVLVHEVSRVARRNSVAHAFLDELSDLGVSLYWHAHSIETLLPNGKRNPAAAIMFSLLAEMARSERELLRERTISGLQEARRRGVTLGRPVGSGETVDEFLAKHQDIVKLSKTNPEGKRLYSIRQISILTGKAKQTVENVLKALKNINQTQQPA